MILYRVLQKTKHVDTEEEILFDDGYITVDEYLKEWFAQLNGVNLV